MRELDKRSRIFLLLIILLILVTFFLDEVQTLLIREKKIGTIRVTEPLVRRCLCVPNKSENQQQTKLNPHENSPHGQTGGRRALATMDKSGLHNVSGLINCK